MIPSSGVLLHSPRYNSTYSDKVYTLNEERLTNDFVLNRDIKLPIGLAYHCAAYIRKQNAIFIHGGHYSDSKTSDDSFLYHFKTSTWTSHKWNKGGCVTPTPLFHETVCGILDKEDLIIIPQPLSCTRILNLKDRDEHILLDVAYSMVERGRGKKFKL